MAYSQLERPLADIENDLWAAFEQIDSKENEEAAKTVAAEKAPNVQGSLKDMNVDHMQPPPSPTWSSCSSLFEEHEDHIFTPEKQAVSLGSPASTTAGENLDAEMFTFLAEPEDSSPHVITDTSEENGVPQGQTQGLLTGAELDSMPDFLTEEFHGSEFFHHFTYPEVDKGTPSTWKPEQDLEKQMSHPIQLSVHEAEKPNRQVENKTHQVMQPASHIGQSTHPYQTPEVQFLRSVEQSYQQDQNGYFQPSASDGIMPLQETPKYVVPDGQSVNSLAGHFGLTLAEVKSGGRNRKAPAIVRNTTVEKSKTPPPRDPHQFAGVQKTKGTKSKPKLPQINGQTLEKKTRKNAASGLAEQQAKKNSKLATPLLLEEANRQMEEAKAAAYLNRKINQTIETQQFSWQQAQFQLPFQQHQAISHLPGHAGNTNPYYGQHLALQTPQYQHVQQVAHPFPQHQSNPAISDQSPVQGQQAGISNSFQATEISPEQSPMGGQRGTAFESPQQATLMPPFNSSMPRTGLLEYDSLFYSPMQTNQVVANKIPNQGFQLAMDQSSQSSVDQSSKITADRSSRHAKLINELFTMGPDNSSEMTLDEPSSMADTQTPQAITDHFAQVGVNQSLAAMYQSPMATNQSPHGTATHSPHGAMYQSPMAINQSPGMDAYPPSSMPAYQQADAYGVPYSPFQPGSYQALQQPNQMAAYNHIRNVPQLGPYNPLQQQGWETPQQQAQMLQQAQLLQMASYPFAHQGTRYYPATPRQQPPAQQAQRAQQVPYNQSPIDQLLRQQVQQSGLHFQQNFMAENLRNSQMIAAQASAAAPAAFAPVSTPAPAPAPAGDQGQQDFWA